MMLSAELAFGDQILAITSNSRIEATRIKWKVEKSFHRNKLNSMFRVGWGHAYQKNE